MSESTYYWLPILEGKWWFAGQRALSGWENFMGNHGFIRDLMISGWGKLDETSWWPFNNRPVASWLPPKRLIGSMMVHDESLRGFHEMLEKIMRTERMPQSPRVFWVTHCWRSNTEFSVALSNPKASGSQTHFVFDSPSNLPFSQTWIYLEIPQNARLHLHFPHEK